MEFEKEKEISEELKTRRSKRRKDEKNYAARELDEDQKNANTEMAASMTGSTSGGDAAMAAVMDFAMGGGIDLSSLGGDAVSFDAIG